MSEVAIRFDGVGKMYKIFPSRRDNLLDALGVTRLVRGGRRRMASSGRCAASTSSWTRRAARDHRPQRRRQVDAAQARHAEICLRPRAGGGPRRCPGAAGDRRRAPPRIHGAREHPCVAQLPRRQPRRDRRGGGGHRGVHGARTLPRSAVQDVLGRHAGKTVRRDRDQRTSGDPDHRRDSRRRRRLFLRQVDSAHGASPGGTGHLSCLSRMRSSRSCGSATRRSGSTVVGSSCKARRTRS